MTDRPDMDVTVTVAAPSRFPELCAVWEESVAATHHFLRGDDFEALKRELPARYLPAMETIWLAEAEGACAGFLGLCGDSVEMLFVRPRFFRRGVGTALLRRAGREAGPLRTTVNEENREALRFYLRRGFAVVGRSPVDGQGRPYPVLLLAGRTREKQACHD